MKIVKLTLTISFILSVVLCLKNDSPIIEDLSHYKALQSHSTKIEALKLINACCTHNAVSARSHTISVKRQAYSYFEYIVSNNDSKVYGTIPISS